MSTEQEQNPFEKLKENLQQYVNTRYDLVTLKVTQKVADMSARCVYFLIVTTILSMLFFFLNIAFAYYLSALFGNNYSGFFIVTGFYLLLAIIIMLGKKQLIMMPIRNFIIKKLLHDEQA